MFQLSLVDHIRLSFGSVVSAFEGHTEAAARLARWSWYAKVAILTLLGLAAAASSAAAVRGGFYTITAAALSAVGFAATAAVVAIDPETRIYGHRATAGRLWLICEKYRALLTEIHDHIAWCTVGILAWPLAPVLTTVNDPVCISRKKTSRTKLASPATRLLARLVNATYRPSALIVG